MQIQHLFFRPSGYHYIIRIPQDILHHFPVRTIWRSLKTKDYKAARVLAKVREHETEKVFMQIRCGLLTNEQIKRLVADFLHGELSSTEKERSKGDSLRHTLTASDDNLDFLSGKYGDIAATVQKDLAKGDLTYGRIVADAIIAKNGLLLSSESEEYQTFCREVMKAEVQRLRIEAQRTIGEYDSETERSTMVLFPPKKKGLMLSELIQKYSQDRIDGEKWKAPKTIADMNSSYSLLLRVKGDFDIDTVTNEFAQDFRKVLKQLPANSSKGQFSDKTVAQILAMPNITPMSVSNLNKNLRRMSELFQYAFKQNLTQTRNYFEGLEIQEDMRENKKRRAFRTEEIVKVLNYLFELLELKKETCDSRLAITVDYVWIFLIGLYTGLRSNELCQMTPDDVFACEEIICFDVKHDVENNKSTKTVASQRVVPVPPQILELGFLRFVESQKGSVHPRLWKSASMDAFGKWNRSFGRNINKYIDEALGGQDRLICYHSTRHNVGGALRRAGADLKVIQDIKGHVGKSTEERFYQHKELQEEYEAMAQMNYGIDLEATKERLAAFM